MYIQVRCIGGQNTTITISKFTSVIELKDLIGKEFHVIPNKQRLFFGGKQLEDDHNVCDYDVHVNDVIQLMVRHEIEDSHVSGNLDNIAESPKEEGLEACDSKYFKVGDIVDAKDVSFGAWFEGKIVGIYKSNNSDVHESVDSEDNVNNDGLIYQILLNRYPYNNPIQTNLKEVRPRSRVLVSALSVKMGDLIMVNYNMERPNERGFWHDLLVKSVSLNKTKTSSVIKGTLYFGIENNTLNNCKIKFINDICKIEKTRLIIDRSEEELNQMQLETVNPRISAAFCDWCRDRTVKCTYCSCHVCGIKTNPEKQVICDECNLSYHIWCLTPQLNAIPEDDEWYCMQCKNDENEIIKAGQNLKKVKIKKGKENKVGNKGRGMACVGRTKDCTIVPFDHIGAIPGIEVGTTWKFRMQVAEAGVHRPHVAGIHGRENACAYSIVLSGGYEDDIDNGEEIIYTGSGGRDLAGRRTAEQSCDQTLNRLNKALALNCSAPFNPIDGAEAKKWQEGKPIRVIRNFRGAKHSKYAPKEGNRYDGLYKVVKYYPEKGKSGFIVWRYLLKRDDPTPPPWTKEGKKRMAALGLVIIYPDGYKESLENKIKENSSHNKRKRSNLLEAFQLSTKRTKVVVYDLEDGIKKEIENDKLNTKVWSTMKSFLQLGKKEFLTKVIEEFTCICCHELIFQPVTMPCSHNICLGCLQRSVAAEIHDCPYCRRKLGKKYKMIENKSLQNILLQLFPGYSAGR